MATSINIDALTLNAKENQDFAKFIVEQTFARPDLKMLHKVMTGITMKEQIVLAGQLGKTGVKGGSDCARVSSGAGATLTEKFWTPEGIEETLIHCNKELNALFKAYFDKIQEYKQVYDIQGSDEEVFVALLIEESAKVTIYRAIWLGDKDVDAAGASAAGLIVSGNSKFYDYFDGFFKQIFDGVTATTIKRYSITENGLTTIAAQTSLSEGRAIEIFEGVWANADARLKASADKIFYVSNGVYENYRQYLQAKGENNSIVPTMDGFMSLTWNGVKVVNMQTIWDLDLQADFINNTTDEAYYLPNRVVLSTPANLAVGTLNENDFTNLESFYYQKDRELYVSYGFSLDAKILEEYMISVAY